jgi:hypothetical protein
LWRSDDPGEDDAIVIDRGARTKLAVAIRHLASGRITNDQFDDQLTRDVRKSRDLGVQAIRWAAWMLYDDLHEHRLDGDHALGRTGRRHVARWILFLKSNQEYDWPDPPTWLRFLVLVPNILTFNLVGAAMRRWRDHRGDADVWPFIRRGDLLRAVSAWPGAGQPAVADAPGPHLPREPRR